MGKMCPNCNNKLGFLNKQQQCVQCEKNTCFKCSVFSFNCGKRWFFGLEVMKIPNETFLCSSGCVTLYLDNWLSKLDKNIPYMLYNVNNIGIMLDEKKEKLHEIDGLTISYLKGTPNDTELPSMIPPVKEIYDYIGSFLRNNNYSFEESTWNEI